MRGHTMRQQVRHRFGAWDLDTDAADWRDLAVCRDGDPDLHFPVGESGPALIQTELAKANCHRCPVAEQCLQWSVQTGQEYGVWGGLNEKERRPLIQKWRREQRERAARENGTGEAVSQSTREYREANRLCLKCAEPLPADASKDRRWCDNCQRQPATCGTPSGYDRRMRRKTAVCDPCRDAYSAQRQQGRHQVAGAA